MKQLLMVAAFLLWVIPGESRAQALVRCDTATDGSIKVRNLSVLPGAVGTARVGDDCLAAVEALLGPDPENSEMDVSFFEVHSVGTEISLFMLIAEEEEDESGHTEGSGGDDEDEGEGESVDNGGG